ncbi:uncharacterized protein EI90DRAFT_2904789 [Cantharellus anzutake]|uniref:uncharacterized protein n=1 Tax=Cantharellus anzutake TaxID=1750568 RepID=UPI001903B37A|nr:uncharacterized protein EI90DRAFT_2904789 [Cantharellus anzutake]KAF8342148.1 hypothetical protein EI90DRAFT_2904789 [Cantharellus anzutake]
MTTSSPKPVGHDSAPTSKNNNDGAPSNDPKPRLPNSRGTSYHLENNPFEASFSQPHSTPSTLALPPPSPPKHHRSSSKDSSNNSGSGSPDANGTIPRPILPPIAAMASPSSGNEFSWPFNGNGDLAGSLRSGPLSPAMLAGPQQYSGTSLFDNMRSGLTPDVNRTGLTPLIGGPTSFPPPSPNTAAFLAMMTNTSQSQGVAAPSPATITPGTFSAITGILNGNNHNSSSSNSNHNQTVAGGHISMGMPANGLFLLSQAHQELTKREEQQAQAAQRGSSSPTMTTQSTNGRRATRTSMMSTATPTISVRAPAGSNKRARNNTITSSSSARSTGRRASNARKRSDETDEDGSQDDDGSQDEGNSPIERDDQHPAKPQQRKPETEEEKRRNFLERNRQAALKCRQRKKAWLNQLQAKVEYLTSENERLLNTTVSMREEISRLSAVVVAHRDCGLGGVSVARSEQLVANNAHVKSIGGDGHVPSNAPSMGGHGSRGAATTITPARRGTDRGAGGAGVPAMVSPVGGGGKGGRYAY